MSELTHINANGEAHMVDVGQKPISERVAVARCQVRMLATTLDHIANDSLKKGDVLACLLYTSPSPRDA